MERQPTTYEVYAGQFDAPADALAIAIPREEIVTEMIVSGERETLDAVCVAVAGVLDALTEAAGRA